MKKISFGLMVVATALLASCGGSTENTATEEVANNDMIEAVSSPVNIDNSSIIWKGTMVGIYSHEGRLSFKEGNIIAAGGTVVGGSFTVDMTSMNPTDENYNPAEDKTPEKLVGHLSSADFFDVANYPTANFQITGSNENSINGKLTIRGITNEEKVENITYDASTKTWKGTLTFDRKKYDVAWDSPMKDVVLQNDIELTIIISI